MNPRSQSPGRSAFPATFSPGRQGVARWLWQPILLFAWLLVPLPAGADEAIWLPTGFQPKRLDRYDVERIPGDLGYKLGFSTEDSGVTFVALGDTPARSRPEPAAPAIGVPLEFRQEVAVYGQQGDFFLIARHTRVTQAPTLLGWVHRDQIQLNTTALKIGPNGPSDPVVADRGLQAKVLLVTSLRHLASKNPSPGDPEVDLRLIAPMDNVKGMPGAGKSLVVVAKVNQVLHFRVFDSEGAIVIDADEKILTDQVQQIEGLKKQLENLWPPHELTRDEKDRLLKEAISLVESDPDTLVTRVGARSGAGISSQLRLFNLYPVWKRVVADDHQEWYLIGRRGSLEGVSDPAQLAQNIVGWIPKNDTRVWPTGIGVEPVVENRSQRLATKWTEPGMAVPGLLANVYADKASVLKVAELAAAGKTDPKVTSIRRVASENLEAEPLRPYSPRFPLFKVMSLGDSNDPASRLEYYQIGLIGSVRSGSENVPYTRVDRARHLAWKIAKQARCIEIVFVLDDTGSFYDFFPAASNAIQIIRTRCQEAFAAKDGISLRFKVLKYRDFCERDGDPNSYVTRSTGLQTLDDADPSSHTIISKMLSSPARREDAIGGGPYEAVFYGLKKAIAPSPRSPDAGDPHPDPVFEDDSWRVVVLLGDAGNHMDDGLKRAGGNPVDTDTNDEPDLKVQEIAGLLKEKDVLFHAIQVCDPGGADTPTGAFQQQMLEIVQRLGGGSARTPKEFYSFTTGLKSDPAKVTDEVVKKILDAFEMNRRWRQHLEDFASGAKTPWDGLPEALRHRLQQVGGDIARVNRDGYEIELAHLERLGIKLGGWVTRHARVQVVEDGFVFARHPAPGRPLLFRQSVLFKRDDLKKLTEVIDPLTREQDERKLKGLFFQTIKDVYEFDLKFDESKSIGDYLAKLAGFPPQNRLLKIPIDRLNDAATLRQLRTYLTTMNSLLKARLYNKKFEVVRDKDNMPIKVVVDRRQVPEDESPWFYGSSLEDEFMWLPMEDVP